MTTESFIRTLKSECRKPEFVATRGALCLFLRKNGVSCITIGNILGCDRRLVYYSMYRMRDLLEVNDKYAREAYDELSNHDITIKPVYVDGNVFNKFLGYKLIIDNIIY